MSKVRLGLLRGCFLVALVAGVVAVAASPAAAVPGAAVLLTPGPDVEFASTPARSSPYLGPQVLFTVTNVGTVPLNGFIGSVGADNEPGGLQSFGVGSDFPCPRPLPVGESCTFTGIFFGPRELGSHSATFYFFSNQLDGPPPTVTVHGVGTPPIAAIDVRGSGAPILGSFPLVFPDTPIGTDSAPQSVVVQELGGLPLHLGAVLASGPFRIVAEDCTGATLPPYGDFAPCLITVVFHPTAVGSAGGAVTVASDSLTPAPPLLLSGNGLGAHLSTPGSLAFPTTYVGNGSPGQDLVLTNDGNLPLHFTGLALPVPFGFRGVVGCNLVLALDPGDSCTLGISFGPPVAGSYVVFYEIDSDSWDGPAFVRLSGIGNDPPVVVLDPIVAEATGPGGAIVAFTVPGVPDGQPPDCTPVSGSLFRIGATTVSCTIRNEFFGIVHIATLQVVVRDTRPSVVGTMPDIHLRSRGAAVRAVAYFTPPSATDAVDGPVVVTCDQASGSAFPVGHTTVDCSAADSQGNTVDSFFDVNVEISISATESGPPPRTTSQDATFTFGTSSRGGRMECSLDGLPYRTCSSPLTYHGLSAGVHTFCVRAVVGGVPDASPDCRTWTIIGPGAPHTTILSGPPPVTSSHDANFSFSADQPAVHFQCSLDGAAYKSCSGPYALHGLAGGPHSLRVRGVNFAGEVEAAPPVRNWTVG